MKMYGCLSPNLYIALISTHLLFPMTSTTTKNKTKQKTLFFWLWICTTCVSRLWQYNDIS